MWERSAATPGVLTTSYNANSVIKGEVLRSRDNGFVKNCQQLFQCGVNIPLDVPVQFLRMHQRQLYTDQNSSNHPLNTLGLNAPALIPIFAVSGIVEFCTATLIFTPHLLTSRRRGIGEDDWDVPVFCDLKLFKED